MLAVALLLLLSSHHLTAGLLTVSLERSRAHVLGGTRNAGAPNGLIGRFFVAEIALGAVGLLATLLVFFVHLHSDRLVAVVFFLLLQAGSHSDGLAEASAEAEAFSRVGDDVLVDVGHGEPGEA